MKKNILIILLVVITLSCNESINDNLVENQKPETHLFLYADENVSQQKSRLQVYWWGDDKDGLVIGYFIKWEGIDSDWTFTTSNDSIFSLPIGTVDTSFSFLVAAVDNNGNGTYDQEIILNDKVIASEPFVDANANNVYDDGEQFIDIGSIDDTPASQKFPIKNTSPQIEWNKASVLPEKSFPVITIGWDANDLDGNETISEIHLALNDTTDFVQLNGFTRLVSLIIDDVNSVNPKMNIFINGDNTKQLSTKLNNIRLDDNNILYIRAVDNSGSKSSFVALPDTGRSWYVEKPKGELLIIDDFENGESATDFYNTSFPSVASNYNILDVENTSLPYQSITFLNTVKLFKYIYWYSDSSPSLELVNLVTQKYLQNGGKIAFSLTFQDSSSTFDFSLAGMQSFLPVESLDEKKSLPFLFPGANILSLQGEEYSNLKTEQTIGFVRTFVTSEITANKIYNLTSNQLKGEISLLNKTKNLFFIGLPLHQCNANNSVTELLQKIFVTEFGLTE
ncbi:MAG: hypothetical protein V3V16_10265 [Melioribacteraceae bacterium]